MEHAAMNRDEETLDAADWSAMRQLGHRGEAHKPLPLALAGTPFQLKVWEALLRVPEGRVVTYQALATAIGAKRASRAVGSAVAANPIAYLIPCHRVIRASGDIGEYRWGAMRKAALLATESCRGSVTRA